MENSVLEKYEQEQGVTEITIPAGVMKIGYSAFKGCSSLTEITIPDGVKSRWHK